MRSEARLWGSRNIFTNTLSNIGRFNLKGTVIIMLSILVLGPLLLSTEIHWLSIIARVRKIKQFRHVRLI